MMKKLVLGITVFGCVTANGMEGKETGGASALMRQSSSLPDLSSKPVDVAAIQRKRSFSDGYIARLKTALRDQVKRSLQDSSTAVDLQEAWNKLFQAISGNGNNLQDLTDCCVSLLEYIQRKDENQLSEDDYIIDDVAIDMFAEINDSLLHYSVTFGREWAIDQLKALI